VRRVPGLVPAERLSELGLEVTAQVWMGPGRRFVHYFVSGGRLVNFVAVVEQDTWTRESWTDRGDPADDLSGTIRNSFSVGSRDESGDQLLVQVRVPCRHHGGREPAGGLLTALSRVDPPGRLDQRREIVR
jgi:hypothetical protein